MLNATIKELRETASREGIPWKWVRDLKNELVRLEEEKRAATVRARQVAWWRYVGQNSGSAPFWRHGFAARFEHRIARGADYTIIPGYDEIAYTLRSTVGEYSEWETDDVWEFLLSDYEPQRPREVFYAEALAMIEDATPQAVTTGDGDTF